MENNFSYERYSRQIILKEFGHAAQEKLSAAKVIVVGAGGLGCPAMQYLAAAGVGTIGIVDFDVVEISNLQRQTIYSVADIGKSKAERTAEILSRFNPDLRIHAYNFKLDSRNAWNIINEYDVVLDGTDNFSTRYLVNDACVLLGKPLVYGAVLRFEGQVGVFNFAGKHDSYKTNYRDLFPKPPLPETVPSCNEAGVIGVLPGIIGTMQAGEVIKIITGIGESLANKIITYNLLSNSMNEFGILPAENKQVSIPNSRSEFENFDYDWFCGIKNNCPEISANDFDSLITTEEVTIVDVREFGELPVIDDFPFIQIPLSQFADSVDKIPAGQTTVIVCQSGKRSMVATRMLKENFPERKIFSLTGGVAGWKAYLLNKVLPPNQNRNYENDEETQRVY